MFITENVPSSLKGELTKWMLQLKSGVFIGTLSSLVGEKLWKKIQEKQGKGGAIWVKTTNSEQRFEISISGMTNRSISNFDGLQLITYPNKKKSSNESIQKNGRKTQIGPEVRKKKQIKEHSSVIWDTENFPKNFISRSVFFKNSNSKIKIKFSGTSAYGEYPPKKLWFPPWMDDIKTIGKALLRFLINLNNLSEQPYYNKKLVCLDIETTDYLPKAYEGFINIIGVAILDLRKSQDEKLNLNIVQAFNMTRKKSEVPLLLTIINPYLKDTDIVLVFNKDFDIKIINTVIQEFSLKIDLPAKVIDLQDFFPNLKSLEDSLTQRVGIKRNTTEKGKYSEYYQLFKGKGKTGYEKKIEPIGSYNLIDTLTPLFMYLILHSLKK